MRGRDKYCITVSGTTNEDMWREIRTVLGPNPTHSGTLDIMNSDISEYNTWISSHGVVPFDKWLIWKIRFGTVRYGQLSEDKKAYKKVGHLYAPCPYSTFSTDLRTIHMLGLGSSDPLPVKVSHSLGGTDYYMTTTARGNRWGFECPFVGCTYYILNGKKYFYI